MSGFRARTGKMSTIVHVMRALFSFSWQTGSIFSVLCLPPTYSNPNLHWPSEIFWLHPGVSLGICHTQLTHRWRHFQWLVTSRQPGLVCTTNLLRQLSGICEPQVGNGWPWCALSLLNGPRISTDAKYESALTW